MVATVRLDAKLEKTLERLSQTLHKKKSDIIREALHRYATEVESTKTTRILEAIKKTKESDKKLHRDFEELADEGL